MESRALKLHITKGPREGYEVEFKPGSRIRIGRVVRGNNVAIKDAGISSKHLSIELDTKSGSWILQDLGSSNGTFINDSDTGLSPDTPYAIHDEDSIKIGEYTSILAKLDCGVGVSELPRNPPRGRRADGRKNLEEAAIGVTKESEEKLGSKEANERMKAAVLESVVDLASTSMKEAETVGPEKEKMEGVCLSPRRTRGRKKKEAEGFGARSGIGTQSEGKNNPGKRTRASSRRKQRNEEKDVIVVEDAEKLNPVVEETHNDLLIADKDNNIDEVSNLGEVSGNPEVNKHSVIKEEPSFWEEDLGGRVKGNEAVNDIHDNVVEEEEEEEDSGGKNGPSPPLDLSKLTVREWFDYLEVYLRKQIIDETEKSLADMRDKVERVKEYVKEQRRKNTGNFEQTA